MSSADLPAPAASEVLELEFAAGLVGLPDAHRFRLAVLDDGPLLELAGLDSGLAFAALPADGVRPGMTDELRARGAIGAGERLLALLSVHGEPAVVTANLAGPLAVDPAAGTARQLVLEGEAYPLRAPVGAAA
ncbi:MAG TPA: flagellar assembly protein FliW [Candidatus Limnocylindrales bacterium]